MDEARARELRGRAEHLTALKNSPSYPALKEIVEARIRADMRRFMTPDDVPADTLHYGRGFMAGASYVLKVIENGEQELRNAIKQAAVLGAAKE